MPAVADARLLRATCERLAARLDSLVYRRGAERSFNDWRRVVNSCPPPAQSGPTARGSNGDPVVRLTGRAPPGSMDARGGRQREAPARQARS